MRKMLHGFGRALGIIRRCGTLVITYPSDDADAPIPFGGGSYNITANGIEGPIYPSIWDDTMWFPRAPRPCEEGTPGPLEDEPATPEKSEESEGRAEKAWPMNSRGVPFVGKSIYLTLIHEWNRHLLAAAEAVFANGIKASTGDTEAEKAERFEQIGRLNMELDWLKKTLPPSVPG